MDELVLNIIRSDGLTSYAAVEEVIRRALPEGQIINIAPINGEGVSNSTRLYRFHHSDGHLKELVVKVGQSIGDKEHRGRTLLSPYLPLAETIGSRQPDTIVYHFIPGLSVSCLVCQDSQIAKKHFQRFVDLNIAMWQRTAGLTPVSGLSGYPARMGVTNQLVKQWQIQGRPLISLTDLPIVVNSKKLPPLGECLHEMSELIGDNTKEGEALSVLQHGDEGAVNFIVRDDDEEVFFIDNGNAGRRLLAEGLAKICLWWIVTAPESRGEARVQDGQICLDYSVSVQKHVSRTVGPAIKKMLDCGNLNLDQRQMAACLANYCLREVQWAPKRRYPFSPDTLLALAFDLATGMFGDKIRLPGLGIEL